MKPYKSGQLEVYYMIEAYLKGVTTLCFAVEHIHNLVIDALAGRVALCPIVARPATVLRKIYILRIIQTRVWAREDIVNDL
jgi:hypothetical protein